MAYHFAGQKFKFKIIAMILSENLKKNLNRDK